MPICREDAEDLAQAKATILRLKAAAFDRMQSYVNFDRMQSYVKMSPSEFKSHGYSDMNQALTSTLDYTKKEIARVTDFYLQKWPGAV